MKRLLSIIAAIGLTATISTSVVSCTKKNSSNGNGDGGDILGHPTIDKVTYSNGSVSQVIVTGTNLQQIDASKTIISNTPKGTYISKDKDSIPAKLVLDLYDINNNPVSLSSGSYTIVLFYGDKSITTTFTI